MREEEGLHPVAILAGILILLVVILLITTSAFQRERLHYMASHLIRKKWRDHKGQEGQSCNVSFHTNEFRHFL